MLTLWKFKSFFKVLGYGLLTGLLGIVLWLTPFGMKFEDSIGLSGLFKLRGPRQAPSDVVIVSIDKASAITLGLRNDPDKWPRTMHAQVITELRKRNATLIVMTIGFETPRPNAAEDIIFRNAIENAGNVILAHRLRRRDGESTVDLFEPDLPIESLQFAALDSASFPLPNSFENFGRAWLWLPHAGDKLTLPTVVLHHLAMRNIFDRYHDFYRNLDGHHSELLALIQNARHQGRSAGSQFALLKSRFVTRPELLKPLAKNASNDAPLNRSIEIFNNWLSLFRRDPGQFLNHYGSARTITTIPYHQLIELTVADRIIFEGKVVFVGFSEDFRLDDGRWQNPFVFSSDENIFISYTELAATSLANLIDNSEIFELDPIKQLLLLMAWGILITLICHAHSLRVALIGLGITVSAYVANTLYQFSALNCFWPVAISLLVQTPFAAIIGFMSRYSIIKRERDNVKQAFQNYLPAAEVSRLANLRFSKDHLNTSDLMQGVCLYTDIEGYSRIAETMDPIELRNILNDYFKAIYDPIKHNGGFVSDIVGDAVLAIWATPSADKKTRTSACRAALGIRKAVKEFNAKSAVPFPTRIGIHCGQIALGHVGAADHLEYRAVGDIVNAANRIEGLNKTLGTRLLVSDNTISGLDGFITRELGFFTLRGRRQTVTVHQILCLEAEIDKKTSLMCVQFAEALKIFRSRQWNEAKASFMAILSSFPDDGPSLYYRQRCDERINDKSSNFPTNQNTGLGYTVTQREKPDNRKLG